jgi:hypothetical protein
VGAGVQLVDSAATTAVATRELLVARDLVRSAAATTVPGRVQYLATDGSARFAAVGSHFLGRELSNSAVEVVDL